MTNFSNAIDDRTESAKDLTISGVHMCVMYVAEKRLNVAWHLMESISVVAYRPLKSSSQMQR